MAEPLRLVDPGTAGAAPLMAIAIRNAGIRKGARAMSVLVSWAVAQRALGHELGAAEGGHLSAAVREYAAYWRQSERTAWRDLDRFRAGFPTEDTPASLAAQLLARDAADEASAAGLLAGA